MLPCQQDGGVAGDAERRPAAIAVVIPTAAADIAVRARWRTLWINHTACRVGPIPVPAPLPHVPVHVIQTPRIRLIAPHRRRPGQRRNRRVGNVDVPGGRVILVVIIKVRHPSVEGAAIMKRCCRPRPARILPLRLRRQPIDPARGQPPRHLLLLCQMGAIVRRIIPTDLLDRTVQVRGNRVTIGVTRGEVARVVPHQRQILPLCHRIFPHVKPLRECNRVLRFTRTSLRLADRAAHHKRPRRNPNHARRRRGGIIGGHLDPDIGEELGRQIAPGIPNNLLPGTGRNAAADLSGETGAGIGPRCARVGRDRDRHRQTAAVRVGQVVGDVHVTGAEPLCGADV